MTARCGVARPTDPPTDRLTAQPTTPTDRRDTPRPVWLGADRPAAAHGLLLIDLSAAAGDHSLINVPGLLRPKSRSWSLPWLPVGREGGSLAPCRSGWRLPGSLPVGREAPWLPAGREGGARTSPGGLEGGGELLVGREGGSLAPCRSGGRLPGSLPVGMEAPWLPAGREGGARTLSGGLEGGGELLVGRYGGMEAPR